MPFGIATRYIPTTITYLCIELIHGCYETYGFKGANYLDIAGVSQ